MKKLFMSALVLTIILFGGITASALTGEGTEEAPFIITSQEELCVVSDFPDCHYFLANDIELTGNWDSLCYYEPFTGVFDGNGKTISNLTYKGLFAYNSGTIKNLNVKTSETGITTYSLIDTSSGSYYTYYLSAGITVYNNTSGVIDNCNFAGKIDLPETDQNNSNSYFSFYRAGGISYKNGGKILNCSVSGSISGYQVGGITYNNSADISKCSTNSTMSSYGAGGIAYYNGGKITYCYSKGKITADLMNSSGIAHLYGSSSVISNCYSKMELIRGYGISSVDAGTVENCYFAGSSASYGVASGAVNSFYDKTITGLTSNSYGTPKTTISMKMKKTYTDAGWDFENIWGIDASINDGYPYLLWEHENVPEVLDYTVNSVQVFSEDGTELSEVPETDSFYVEVNVTKNTDRNETDSVVIAMYDEEGRLIDMTYLKGRYIQNQNVSFGTIIKDDGVKSIKAFVWDSVFAMNPLSNTAEN